MRIGIDLDNTIACYDGVFSRAAREAGLVVAASARDKIGVREHLRQTGRAAAWTWLQGYVYGTRMDLVSCYPGFLPFLRRALDEGHRVFVISHKTRYPYRGRHYDLHTAARAFLARYAIPPEDVFFEPTQGEKRARIAAQDCDVFIDDLPEFLAGCQPAIVAHPVLFDPCGRYPDGTWDGHRFQTFPDWPAIATALLDGASDHAP